MNNYRGKGKIRLPNHAQSNLRNIYRHLQKKDKQLNLKVGDKVLLNVAAITGRSDYWKMNPMYQKFVEENECTVFTVKRDEKSKNLQSCVTFEEDDTWLFWIHDLKIVH